MREISESSDFSWVLTVLERFLGNGVTSKPTIRSARQIGDRYGFLSKIFKLELDWGIPETGPQDCLPPSIVVKVCTTNKAFSSLDGNLEDTVFDSPSWGFEIHAKECHFYEFMARNGAQCNMPLPRYFGSVIHTDPLAMAEAVPQCLLLEELTENTWVPHVTDGLSIQLLNSAVDALAEFHAFSYTDKSWVGEDFDRDFEKTISGVKPLVAKLGEQVRKDHSEFQDTHLDIANRVVLNDELWLAEFCWTSRELTTTHVLSHGDLWAHNLLYEKAASGGKTPKLKAILDWQFASVGSPTQDLARLLASSVTPEVRRAETASLLDRYYAQLGKLIEEKNLERGAAAPQEVLNSGCPFTRSQLDDMYHRSQAISAALNLVDLGSQVDFAKTRGYPEDAVNAVVTRCIANIEDAARYA